MNAKFTLNKRSSGILLHPTSLPGGHGCGDLGPEAYRFVDFLSDAGQRWWQMLPITPPGSGNSPYHASSAFAGSPLLLSLELLFKEGFLDSGDIIPEGSLREGRVAYGAVKRYKEVRFKKAFMKFKKRKNRTHDKPFERFCEKAKFWLEDYALFSALKGAHGNTSWVKWDLELRSREGGALVRAKEALGDEMDYHKFVQYLFSNQWSKLKEHCARRGIGLIGDIPIFVAHDSTDVWAHQEFFWMNKRGEPTVVAGVPPDYFSQTGQRWGNPLYRWDRLREQNYLWWIERLRLTFERFNAVRLDHFIGFHRYWEISADEPTARNGKWVEGPGADFFEKVLRVLGPLELIAEDLGLVTPEVKALRDRFHFPGLRVLQFAFGGDSQAIHEHLPENYPRRCIVYTGTHDNDTTLGWFNDTGSKASTRSRETIHKERAFALRYLKSDGRQIHWDMIRLAMMSIADVAIFPMQDILGLGSRARMNLPGTVEGNWQWRFTKEVVTEELTKRLRLMTKVSRRLPSRS